MKLVKMLLSLRSITWCACVLSGGEGWVGGRGRTGHHISCRGPCTNAYAYRPAVLMRSKAFVHRQRYVDTLPIAITIISTQTENISPKPHASPSTSGSNHMREEEKQERRRRRRPNARPCCGHL